MSPQEDPDAMDGRRGHAPAIWLPFVALAASLTFAFPLVLKGTPDVESYSMSVFSTVTLVRNLLAGADPWSEPRYGFGIPMPSSTWLISFPPALLAAAIGIRAVYAAIWIGGEFCFSLYLLALTGKITSDLRIRLVVLVTGMLSFSNLGPSYVDDWPEHFLGWALLPACVWHALRTLLAETAESRRRQGAILSLVLGVFVGSAHQNEIVTMFSGMAIPLAALLPSRTRGVAAVGLAAFVALGSGLAVFVPTVEGWLSGNVNPVTRAIEVVDDDLSAASYGVFMEPGLAMRDGGMNGWLSTSYRRAPFFGLAGLVLAFVGAARLLTRPGGSRDFPADVSRALALGFAGYTILTLLPSWVVLGLPRMWMYRDGQTVFALLCMTSALAGMGGWTPLARLATAFHLAQLALVAAPTVGGVLGQAEPPLFAYASGPRSLFDGLRSVGVDSGSRVAIAGEFEGLIRGQIPRAGITSGVDFPREGIALVNAWYRGGQTPTLGRARLPGRYGAYETVIQWNDLRELEPEGLDVLGITHVVSLAGDADADRWRDHLSAPRSLTLPDGRVLEVRANGAAWPRAVLLDRTAHEPPARPECPDPTIYCRDFSALRSTLRAVPSQSLSGSTLRVALPPGHEGGLLLISQVLSPWTRATVDGRSQPVEAFLGSFGVVRVGPGDHEVRVPLSRPDRMALSAVGLLLMTASAIVALRAGRRA